MSDTLAIREVVSRLKSATTFAAIFGALPGNDLRDNQAHLRKQFGYLARLVHPDHAPSALEAEASEAFRILNDFRHAAESALERGSYDAPFDAKDAAGEVCEITTIKGTYRLRGDIFREGDFSILYRGTLLGATPAPVLAKVARDPTQNTWLEKEAAILKNVADARVRTPLFTVSPFLPALLDTAFIEGEGGVRYRANLYRFVPEMVSIADIMRAYPKGLEPSQAAWIARRIFAQTIAASMLGVVHGAITPDHVLVHPVTHDPLHIGWAQAIRRGRITHIIDRWRDVYPPEVFDRKEADHRTDIYMASATIVKLLGGDVRSKALPGSVPNEVARIILRGLEPSPARRPEDGKQLLEDFTRVVRSAWGRAYRPLIVPVR